MACFNSMSKKLEAEVKHLEGDLNAALGKLNNLETQARADRDGYEEKLTSYGKEVRSGIIHQL